MTFDTKVVMAAKKEHTCMFCLSAIKKGTPYVSAPHTDDITKEFTTIKLCPECAYIVKKADRKTFKKGNFTETNIPNCLRKLRNEYRKDPGKAWDDLMEEENEISS